MTSIISEIRVPGRELEEVTGFKFRPVLVWGDVFVVCCGGFQVKLS